MNLYDFLIIYLAAGAPLGVYYFLHERKRPDFKHLWIKTLLNFLFWAPFAVRLLRQNKISVDTFNNVFGEKSSPDADAEKIIHSIRKRFEKIYLETGLDISIYEFREVLERYSGLTRAGQFEEGNSQTARYDNEFFRIADHKNAELAAICLERRNRRRLSFHQTEARLDFLQLLSGLSDSGSEKEILFRTAIEFVTELGDDAALDALKKMFEPEWQTKTVASVRNAETDLWKADIQQPLLTGPDSNPL